MYEWSYARFGGWSPLWWILGTAAMALVFALFMLFMEAVVGSRTFPASRRGLVEAPRARGRRARSRGYPSRAGGSSG
jgi:hypothetical protein